MADDAIPLPGVSTVTSITDWENLFYGALTSGVLSQGSLLAPSLDSAGRHAVIAPGGAILRGFYKPISAATSTAIPAASGQNRIDRLVLRLNRGAGTSATFVVPTVIAGTPAANPQEPSIQRTSNALWDLPIMSWTSQSSGTLTGLKDERVFLIRVLAGPSTARPQIDTSRAVLLETDTGNVAMWDGSSWHYLTSADTFHTITHFTSSGWSGSLSYCLVTPQLVCVTANLNVTTNATTIDGTQIATVPAGYRPKSIQGVVMRSDAMRLGVTSASGAYAETSGLRFGTDGSVQCHGVGGPATYLFGSGVYPLGV